MHSSTWSPSVSPSCRKLWSRSPYCKAPCYQIILDIYIHYICYLALRIINGKNNKTPVVCWPILLYIIYKSEQIQIFILTIRLLQIFNSWATSTTSYSHDICHCILYKSVIFKKNSCPRIGKLKTGNQDLYPYKRHIFTIDEQLSIECQLTRFSNAYLLESCYYLIFLFLMP